MSLIHLRRNAWLAEGHRLQTHLDSLPLRLALAALFEYHTLTGYAREDPDEMKPVRGWRADHKLSLVGYRIPSRADRLGLMLRTAPAGVAAVAGGNPLSVDNQFWQQRGDQFAYARSHNGRQFHYLVQFRPFGRNHFTIATANQEPQGWRGSPMSLDVLHQRVLDDAAIAAQLGCLVLRNGERAAASLDWNHVHALAEPEDGPLPVRQAMALAGDNGKAVMKLDEPHWPLPAFRIRGPVEQIAGEVCSLAERCTRAGGKRATESMAYFLADGEVTCVFVPRDTEREYSERFCGKLGAFETATGSLVFADAGMGLMLRKRKLGFKAMWAMLRDARPEWADAL